MRNIAATCPYRAIFSLALAAMNCGSGSEQAPATYPAHDPSGGPQATQATGTSNGTAPVLAASPATPGAPSAVLSTPNPLALPCTVDAHCLTHHCNVPAKKCAWPCQTDNDCMPGNACIAPTCLPKLQ
jgi:hypothetical protein